jgi:hypothetical protein
MRWGYKTVHYPLKKEGLLGSAFLDQAEVEQSLNEYGMAGWELVALVDSSDDGLIGVFKQPLGRNTGPFVPSPEEEDQAENEGRQAREDHRLPVVAASDQAGAAFLADHEVVRDLADDPGGPKRSPAVSDLGAIKIE